MKKSTIMFLSLFLLVLNGCKDEKAVNKVELYGNTFIDLDTNDFDPPSDWVTHYLFDSAFQIKLPPYMIENITSQKLDSPDVMWFKNKGMDKNGEIPFGVVNVYYGRLPCDTLPGASDVLPYETMEALYEPIIENAKRDYIDQVGLPVPGIKIINGPFYRTRLLSLLTVASDAFYRRKGNMEGKGPVSVHIFIFMNRREMTELTVSYHDQDSLYFKDMFNVVKTFRWSHKY